MLDLSNNFERNRTGLNFQNKESSYLIQAQEFNKDLKIRDNIDNKIKLGCVMNMNFLGDEGFNYRVFQCFSCPGKLENICDYCFHNCHTNHNAHLKGVVQLDKEVNISKTPCDCALGNHDFKNFKKDIISRKSSEEFNDSSIYKCPVNDVIASIDPKYYFFDTRKKRYLCFYCAEYCVKDFDESIEEQEKETYNNASEKWSPDNILANREITNKDNKSFHLNFENEPKIVNKSDLNFSLNNKFSLLDDRIAIVSASNLVKHPPCQCSSSENHSSLSDNIMNLSAMLSMKEFDLHFNSSKIPYQLLTNKNPLISGFLDKLIVVFNDLVNNFYKPKDFELNPFQFPVNKVIDSSLLLLKSIADLSEKKYKMHLPKISNSFTLDFLYAIFNDLDDRSNMTNKAKCSILYYYRRFTLEPELSSKNKSYKYLGYNENSSFMHRALFMNCKEDFMNLGFTKDKFFNFLSKLSNSISFLHEKIEDSVFIELVKEYVKYNTIIINYLYYDMNKLEKIIDCLYNVLFLVKEKKDYITMISDIEYIVYNILLFKNDFILRSKLGLTQIDYAYDSINNNKRFDMINFKLGADNIKKDYNYVFQNDSEFNIKLVKLIFNYTSYEINSISKYLKNDYIYDLLVFNEDYYLESLENIKNNDFNIFNSQINCIFFKQIDSTLTDKILSTGNIKNQNYFFSFNKKEEMETEIERVGFNLTSLFLLSENKAYKNDIASPLVLESTGISDYTKFNNNFNITNNLSQNNFSASANFIVNKKFKLGSYFNEENSNFNFANNDYLIKLLNENLDFDYYSILGESLTDYLIMKFNYIHNLILKFEQSETFNEKKFMTQAFYTLEMIFSEINDEMKNQKLYFNIENIREYNYKDENINKAFADKYENNFTVNDIDNVNLAEVEEENKEEKNEDKDIDKYSLRKNNAKLYNSLQHDTKLFAFQTALYRIGLYDKIMDIWNTIIHTPYLVYLLEFSNNGFSNYESNFESTSPKKTTATNTVDNTEENRRFPFDIDNINLDILTKLKTNDKDTSAIKKLSEDIDKYTIGLIDLMMENNPFLSSLLFNRVTVKRLLRSNTISLFEKLSYFKSKLLLFKEKNYSINCEYLIKKIVKLTKCYMTTTNTKIFNLALEIYKLCLDVSLAKSKRKITELLVGELNNILTNQIFIQELDHHFHVLQLSNKSYINSMVKTMEVKSTEGKNLIIINNSDDIAEIHLNDLELYLKNLLVILNDLPNEYFMLIVESLPIDIFSAFISCHYSLNPELKVHLINLYTRFLLDNNYFISKEVSNEFLIKNLQDHDVNLIGKIENGVIADNIEALIDKSQKNKHKKFDFIAENNGFNPIIESLQMFISNYNKFKPLFENNVDFFLQYFESIVLKPCILAIYKLIFYTNNVNADIKYHIYKFVYFFTANCKFFMSTISVDDITHLSSQKKIFLINTEGKISSVKSFKDELLDELNEDVDNLQSKSFDHLNLEIIFCILFKYVRLFSLYRDLTNHYLFNLDSLIEEYERKNKGDNMKLEKMESIFGQSGNNFFKNKQNSHSRKNSNNLIGNPSFHSRKSKSKNYNELQEDLIDNNSSQYDGNILSNSNTRNLQFNNNIGRTTSNILKDSTGLRLKNISVKSIVINNTNTQNFTDRDKVDKLDASNVNLLENDEAQKNLDILLEDTFYSLLEFIVNEYREYKENYFEKNILNDVFLNENPDLHYVKKTIAADLFNKLTKPPINSNISLFSESNYNLIQIVNKLFKTEPHIWQEVISESNNAKLFIEDIIEQQLFFLHQFILVDFCRLGLNREKNEFYSMFLHNLEFLRLTCEDHNKIYQTYVINNKINSQVKLTSFIFLMKITVIKFMEKYLAKSELLRFFRDEKISKDYFNDFIEKLTDYLIEIIQGAFSYNFNKITKLREFQTYVTTYYKYFDVMEMHDEYEPILFQFMRFINCYFEENSNLNENKLTVAKKFNEKKLQTILLYAFKKLNYIYCNGNNESEKDHTNDSPLNLYYKINETRQDKALFLLYQINTTASRDLIKQYILNDDFKENPLFNMSTSIFMFLKRTSAWKGGEKSATILNNLRALSQIETTLNQKNLQSFLIKKEMFVFYDTLIKDVEISYSIDDTVEESILRQHKHLFKNELKEHYDKIVEASNNKKNVLDSVVFIAHPDTLFIEKGDRENFIQIAPYDHFNEKLNYFLEYFDTFRNKLLMRKILWETESWFLNKIYRINYSNMEIVSAFFSLIVNILMLVSVNYKDTKKDIIDFPLEMMDLQIAIFHNFFLIFLIINWYSFKIYETSKFEKVSESFFGKLSKFSGLLLKTEILPFIWNLFFGLLAVSFESLQFLFAIQLFTIFNIVPTMSSVLYAVRIRYKQFASTAYMLIILVFLYTAITYYNFSGELLDSNNKVRRV